MLRKPKFLIYVYSGLLVIILAVIVITLIQINNLDSLYAFHTANLNMSGFCGSGLPTIMLFYGNSCSSCGTELSSFVNTTSLFGIWQGQRFYSSYFCAYSFNVSAYDSNQSSVFAPAQSPSVFNTLSDGKIPLLVFNGEYYKIGGFNTASSADSSILEYICKVINSSAPECH